jgi:hypothetical protein
MPLTLVIVLAAVVVIACAAVGTVIALALARRRAVATKSAAARLGLAAAARPGWQECAACGAQGHAFGPDGACANCGASDLDRLLCLYLLNETGLLGGQRRLRVLIVGRTGDATARIADEPLLEVHEADSPAAAVAALAPGAGGIADAWFDAVLWQAPIDREGAGELAFREVLGRLAPDGWALTTAAGPANAVDPRVADGMRVTSDAYGERVGRAHREHFGLPLDAEVVLYRRVAGSGLGHAERILSGEPDDGPLRPLAGLEATLIGRVEAVRDGIVSGWAWQPAAPERRLSVAVLLDGRVVATGVADQRRASLKDAGIGDAAHGFSIALPPDAATKQRHRLRVEVEGLAVLAAVRTFQTSASEASPWDGTSFVVEGSVQGRVEGVHDGAVSGWALRPSAPDSTVWIRVMLDGREACSGPANLPRGNTESGGLRVRHGFRLQLPPEIAARTRHCLRVEVEGDVALPAAATFATTTERSPWWTEIEFVLAAASTTPVAVAVEGRVEAARDGVVDGWAWQPAQPSRRVWVRACAAGEDLAAGVAEEPRPALLAAGIGDGRYGFRFALPAQDGMGDAVHVETEDGTVLPVADAASGNGSEPPPTRAQRPNVVRGRVEKIRSGTVSGWAFRPVAPEWRVGVTLIVDGRAVAHGVADLARPSLAQAGIGDGRHGFAIRLPATVLIRGVHTLRVEAEGAQLAPAARFGAADDDEGRELDDIQFQIDGAARRLRPPAVTGRIEGIDGRVLSGWVWTPSMPVWRTGVRLLIDGSEHAQTMADLHEPTLEGARVGDGSYGFRFELPETIAGSPPRRVRVVTESGVTLPAAAGFGGASYVAELSPERCR